MAEAAVIQSRLALNRFERDGVSRPRFFPTRGEPEAYSSSLITPQGTGMKTPAGLTITSDITAGLVPFVGLRVGDSEARFEVPAFIDDATGLLAERLALGHKFSLPLHQPARVVL